MVSRKLFGHKISVKQFATSVSKQTMADCYVLISCFDERRRTDLSIMKSVIFKHVLTAILGHDVEAFLDFT